VQGLAGKHGDAGHQSCRFQEMTARVCMSHEVFLSDVVKKSMGSWVSAILEAERDRIVTDL
jgi:hypothetical protein